LFINDEFWNSLDRSPRSSNLWSKLAIEISTKDAIFPPPFFWSGGKTGNGHLTLDRPTTPLRAIASADRPLPPPEPGEITKGFFSEPKLGIVTDLDGHVGTWTGAAAEDGEVVTRPLMRQRDKKTTNDN